MKKKCIISLACMMAVSMSVPAFAADFYDINDVPWDGAKTYINSAADQGLMVGSTDKSGHLVFRAKENVTLCETMQMAYNLAKKQGASTITNDVKSKWSSVMTSNHIPDWVQEAVAYGLENNIITAGELPNFVDANGTNKTATREAACTIFGKTLEKQSSVNSSATLSFADAGSISSAAVPYIDLLVRMSIVSGDDNNQFNPSKNINRAEMAVIITKAVQAAPASGGNQAQSSSGTLTGSVLTVEGFGATTMITVLDGASQRGFIGSDEIPVTNGGKTVKFSSIGVGDTVTIEYEGSIVKNVTITVDAVPDSAAPSDADTHKVSGTIDELQETRLKLEYDGDAKDVRSYGIKDADALKVKLNGSDSSFNDLLSALKKYSEISAELTVYTENGAEYILELSATTDIAEDGTASGELRSIESDSVTVKLSNGNTKEYDYDKDDIKLYLDDESTTVKDLDKAIDKNDTVKVKITVKNKKVTRLEAETDGTESKDGSGKISSISDSSVKVGSKTYKIDDTSDVSVDVDDGNEAITTFKNLVEAVEDDDKTIEAKITVKSGYVTKITGEVTEATGELKKVSGDDITVDYDGAGEVRYSCDDDVTVKLDGDSIDLDELDDAMSDDDIEVTITIEDGDVTYIKAKVK